MRLDSNYVPAGIGNKMCSAGVSGAYDCFFIAYRLIVLVRQSLVVAISAPVPVVLFQQIVSAAVTAQRIDDKKLEDIGKMVEEFYTNLRTRTHTHAHQVPMSLLDIDSVERLVAALVDMVKEFYTSALQRMEHLYTNERHSESAWSLSEQQKDAAEQAASGAAFLADVAESTYQHALANATVSGQSFARTRSAGFLERAQNAAWHLATCEEYAKQRLQTLKEVQKTIAKAEEHISSMRILLDQLPNNFL